MNKMGQMVPNSTRERMSPPILSPCALLMPSVQPVRDNEDHPPARPENLAGVSGEI